MEGLSSHFAVEREHIVTPTSQARRVGRVIIAAPLLGYGLYMIIAAFAGPPGALRTFGIAFGFWMVIVGLLLLATRAIGHYAAIPTYAWLAFSSLLTVLQGDASKLTFIWSAVCGAAIVFSAIVLWRRKLAQTTDARPGQAP